MNGHNLPPAEPPMYGLIKFLAVIGLLTIFGIGIFIGISLASGGF